MTADEQGPDTTAIRTRVFTGELAEYPTLILCDALDASRTERDTAITEYKALVKRSTFDERTQRAEKAEAERDTALGERDRLDDELNTAYGGRSHWRSRAEVAEAAVVTARRDALTAVIDRVHRSSGVGWSNITRDDLLVWLDAVRAKETP